MLLQLIQHSLVLPALSFAFLNGQNGEGQAALQAKRHLMACRLSLAGRQ